MTKRLVTIIFFVLVSFLCNGQVDSGYIAPTGYDLGVRTYVSQKFLVMEYTDSDDNYREYVPNMPVGIGVGIVLYNTIIDFDMGYSFNVRDKERYGNTKSFDVQVHSYQRKFAVDAYYQYYKGFYEEEGEDVVLHPNMRIRHSSLHGQYVFNHNKFSYKAAFGQNERQLRRAGSWLAGGEAHRTSIRSDEPFTINGNTYSRNYHIGVNGGYANTWVIGKRSQWNISLVVVLGLALGNEAFKDDTNKVMVFPTMAPRVAFGYDTGRWAFKLSGVVNGVLLSEEKNGNAGIFSGNVKFSACRRFNRSKGLF